MGRETHDKGWECEECGSYNSDLTREFCPLCGKFSNEPSSGLSNPLGYQWYRNDIHDSGYNTVSDTGSSTSPSTTTITGPSSELFVLEQRALYEASLHFQPRVEHDPHKSPLDIALGFASKRASDAASVAAPQIVPYASFYSAPGDSSAAPQSTFFNDASAWSNSEPSSSVTKTRDLVEEVAILFWQDEYIRNMVCGFGNFPLVEALFPSHLERMASELPDEASGPKQIWVAEYVALKSSLISAAFVARAKYVSIRRSEAEGWIFSPNPQNVLSGPGRYHTKGATTSHKIRSGSSAGREDEISLADVDLRSLADLKNFVVDSSAFNRLRKELRKTLYPSLKELLLDRIEYTERQSPSPEMLDEIWHARSLARELNNVDPATVIKCGRTSPGLFTYLQRRIESWTAEQWDWWPLTGPCVHDGTLLQWHCNCGEKICMAVPASLADAVIALSASMSASGPLGRNQRPITPPHSTSPSSQTHSNGQTSSTAQSTIGSPHDPQQVLGSGPSRRAAVRPLRSISGWVFLVVKRGGDYRLSQINVHGHASIDFFRHLRAEYFRLRGLFPRYFSVWVFSHCDFYKFEKFEEYAVALRRRDQYPDPQNPQYSYNPKPIVEMPPITKFEFKKRFYSSMPSLFHFRCRRNCQCAKLKKKAHNAETVELLPKKTSPLDIGSETKEIFWGLYARHEIHFGRVLVYNVICVTPVIWFFFMWVLHWGDPGDMQSASVPLMAMLSFLSIFWSLFIATLRAY